MARWLFTCVMLVPLAAIAAVTEGGPTAPDGRTEVMVDLPTSERIKNIGSKVDGAGMCVMSSIEMAARWQGLEQMRGLRDWCANQPGGAYPSKVDRQLKEFCEARSLTCPAYSQEEDVGSDRVRAVLATGRMACVTYAGQDGVRYRGKIAHMVSAVHGDGTHVALLDNNAVGERELLWMTPGDFSQRFPDRRGWLFYWHAPPPPPVPRN